MTEVTVLIAVPQFSSGLRRALLAAVQGSGGDVVVGAPEGLVGELAAVLPSATVVVSGVPSRAECLAAALNHVAAEHVLVHDCSSALATHGVRDRVLAALRSGQEVVVPAVPMVDSVKAVDDQGSIVATVDRTTLSAAHYPRGFTVAALSQLLANRTSDDFDEVHEAIRQGVAVTVVAGEPDAALLELPRDESFAAAVTACR